MSPPSDAELAGLLRDDLPSDALAAAWRRIDELNEQLDVFRRLVTRAQLLAAPDLLAWTLIDLYRPDVSEHPALDVLTTIDVRRRAA